MNVGRINVSQLLESRQIESDLGKPRACIENGIGGLALLIQKCANGTARSVCLRSQACQRGFKFVGLVLDVFGVRIVGCEFFIYRP